MLFVRLGIPSVFLHLSFCEEGKITEKVFAQTGYSDYKPKNYKFNKFLNREHWIMYRSMPKGKIIVDTGAKKALVNNHSSLLPKGIIDVTGNFLISQIVDIVDENDNLLARGIVNYSSDEIKLIKGLNTSEIENILNYKDYDEIVHANNLVLVEGVKNND